MRDVPKLRFKEFEEKWERKSIDDVSIIVGGATPLKSNTSYWNGTIPWVSSQEVGSRYLIRTTYNITEKAVSETNVREVPINSILMVSRSGILKRTIPFSLVKKKMTINQDVKAIMPFDSQVDSLFMYQWLKGNEKALLGKTVKGGTTVQSVSMDLFKQYPIYVPSLKEQLKIADFLNFIDDKIEMQQEKIELLKKQKKGYMQKIFNRELRFKDENDDDFSKWEKYKLGEVIEEYILKTTEENQYPILSSTNSGLFLQSDYFKKQIASQSNKGYKVLKENQIVLSPQNLWMGNINYNSKFDIGIVSPSYKVFNIRDGFSNLFISYLIKTPRMMYNYKTSSEQGASIVRRNLDMNQFLDIEIYLPCLEEQKRIGNFLYLLEKRIKKNQTLKDDLLQQKKSLMQKMFI